MNRDEGSLLSTPGANEPMGEIVMHHRHIRAVFLSPFMQGKFGAMQASRIATIGP